VAIGIPEKHYHLSNSFENEINFEKFAIFEGGTKIVKEIFYFIQNIRSVKQFSRESVVHLIHRSEKLKTFAINWRPKNEDLVQCLKLDVLFQSLVKCQNLVG
jgi:hypothetical protein